MNQKRFWLLKSEPSAYSFSDLLKEPDQTAEWDGIRNYQARNLLRDELKVGDGVLFYHSSTDPLAVVGTAVVVRAGHPDHTAWDPSSDHYDPKSTPDNPHLVHGGHQGRGRISLPCHPGADQSDPRAGEHVAAQALTALRTACEGGGMGHHCGDGDEGWGVTSPPGDLGQTSL